MGEDEKQDLPAEQQPRPSGKDVPPSIKSEAFCCPHCGAYTHQYWHTLLVKQQDKGSLPFIPQKEILTRLDEMPETTKEIREHWKRMVEKYQSGNIFLERGGDNYTACLPAPRRASSNPRARYPFPTSEESHSRSATRSSCWSTIT